MGLRCPGWVSAVAQVLQQHTSTWLRLGLLLAFCSMCCPLWQALQKAPSYLLCGVSQYCHAVEGARTPRVSPTRCSPCAAAADRAPANTGTHEVHSQHW